jgi:hypothetical protein
MIPPRKLIKAIRSIYQEELDDYEMTQLLYLIDWKSCILYGKPMTPIDWKLGPLGPEMKIKHILNHLQCFLLQKDLSFDEMNVIRFVLITKSKMSPTELDRLVFSTYPVFMSKLGKRLDLARLSDEYLKFQRIIRVSEYKIL